MFLMDCLIACLYLSSVSLPDLMSKTIGLAPFCWGGNFAFSRSVASWLPVPGRETSLLVDAPNLPTAPKTTTSSTTQRPMTSSGLRAQDNPSRCSRRATEPPQPGRRAAPRPQTTPQVPTLPSGVRTNYPERPVRG